jgi:hypothetical protein
MFSLTKNNENFRDAFLFKNKALTLGICDNRVLSELNFNGGFFTMYEQKIKKLARQGYFFQ